jgi:4-diphosphocytidyl-2-C-methyl-D-erythritol kinase
VSKQVIEALSPAKLNLFLHVTGQRDNGYHELQTAFQLLNWGDRMRFEITETTGITLHPPVAGLPNEDNLIFRAAASLGLPEDRGVAISIEKVIPMGGGLGGGSSNAAVTLLALNDLLDLGYSVGELALKGAALGADVPVFVRGTSAWAEGIGDELTPLELPARWFVIIYPDCHVSTKEIFGAPELTRNTPPITVSAFFEGPVRNDLQPVVESRYEQVSTAIKWLSNHGSAMMTGSGACVFASFQSQAEAQRIAEDAKREFNVFVAKGINCFTVV